MSYTFPPAPINASGLAAARAPFGHSRMLPAEAYLSQSVLDWEREFFLDSTWVCAGRSADVSEPKCQKAIKVGHTSVLLSRDADGVLHVFANICRHRGHELLPCGASAIRGVIQCPYHAWTYELSGELRIAPHFGDVPNFDQANLGLVTVRHAEWNGWVFVNVSGNAPNFLDHVDALDRIFANYELHRLLPAATHEYVLEANWKLAIENYQECYHCPLIHPELCRVSEHSSGDNYNYTGDAGLWVGGTMDLEDFAATMSLDGASGGEVLRGLNDQQRRQVDYIGVFPNLLVSLHPDYVMTHTLTPLTPTSTHVECQWLFAPESISKPGFDPAYASDFWHLTNGQDWAAVQSVQRGMQSPKYVPGLLADNEDAVYQWVSLIASGYAGERMSRGSTIMRA